jgi:hypothetical protein
MDALGCMRVMLARARLLGSREIAFVALAFWAISLLLPVFVFYPEQERWFGVQILLIGWLGAADFMFAWFANVFFLWGFVRLKAGRPSIALAAVTLLFALDCLRVSAIPLNEAGGRTPIWGYGWGFLAWFAALCLLAIAAGTREIEERKLKSEPPGESEWWRPAGFALLILALSGSAYLGIRDRVHANTAELQRLSGILFKRGRVCGVEVSPVTEPLRTLAGPLELQVSTETDTSSLKLQLTRLLRWGIPTVRFDGADYSYATRGKENILTSVPAVRAPAAATLLTTVSAVGGSEQVRLKLIEGSNGRVLFDQEWRQEQGPNYCPDYFLYSSGEDQPGKLVLEALSLPADASTEKHARTQSPRVVAYRGRAAIVSTSEAPIAASHGQSSTTTRASPEAPRRHMRNRSCPDDVGWGERTGEDRLKLGIPFHVGQRSFYSNFQGAADIVCAARDVYFYSGGFVYGTYKLQISKRALSDFHEEWQTLVLLYDRSLAASSDSLTIDSIEESADALTLAVSNEESGRSAVIRAPLEPWR